MIPQTKEQLDIELREFYTKNKDGRGSGYGMRLIQHFASEQAKQQSIAFKDWCDNSNAWFFDNQEQHTHTTEQLFQIFISPKQQPNKSEIHEPHRPPNP